LDSEVLWLLGLILILDILIYEATYATILILVPSLDSEVLWLLGLVFILIKTMVLLKLEF
jgi:hypothetical protein